MGEDDDDCYLRFGFSAFHWISLAHTHNVRAIVAHTNKKGKCTRFGTHMQQPKECVLVILRSNSHRIENTNSMYDICCW